MGKINIGCKKATYLLSKKEQNSIRLLDRIVLLIHLAICDVCRRFDRQMKLIILNSKNSEKVDNLSEDRKLRIIKQIVES